MCMGAIYWARIARVFYACVRSDVARVGFDDSFIYRQFKLSPDRMSIPMIQIMREEASATFRAWEKQQDRKPY